VWLNLNVAKDLRISGEGYKPSDGGWLVAWRHRQHHCERFRDNRRWLT
jgi:hypothetical protein